jgi:hypothetical protein
MDLATTLQRLYDNEINVTITWLWDGGFDFAMISYMKWQEAGRPIILRSDQQAPEMGARLHPPSGDVCWRRRGAGVGFSARSE